MLEIAHNNQNTANDEYLQFAEAILGVNVQDNPALKKLVHQLLQAAIGGAEKTEGFDLEEYVHAIAEVLRLPCEDERVLETGIKSLICAGQYHLRQSEVYMAAALVLQGVRQDNGALY